jgi:predicted Fe-Mo cluster-binding NifX family protein
MITVIPTDDKVHVSSVFGRAEWFALYADTSAQPEFLAGNSGAEHGAGTGMAARLVERQVQQICAAEIGPKALEVLKAAGVHIRIVKAGTALADLR